MADVIDTIVHTFSERGSEAYGSECVTQLEHALQSAQLASAERAGDALVAAALLHDIGHILEAGALPTDCDTNLDDRHEARAYDWLVDHFGREVADPVRLHVPAKRYLCTVEPAYEKALSPTSHKSYLDQGGPMSEAELAEFRAEPHCAAALRLRRWDDAAKVAGKTTPHIEDFVPPLRAALKAKSGGVGDSV
jgi:phosphonate degradation associated HDIG domain protein